MTTTDELTGRELNEALALHMGYEWYHYQHASTGGYCNVLTNTERARLPKVYQRGKHPHATDTAYHGPDWQGDPAAMTDLLEHFADNEHDVGVYHGPGVIGFVAHIDDVAMHGNTPMEATARVALAALSEVEYDES